MSQFKDDPSASEAAQVLYLANMHDRDAGCVVCMLGLTVGSQS